MERATQLERFLSEEERLHLEKIRPAQDAFASIDFSNEQMLERVHWSWFLPTLKSYPEPEQKLFVYSLSAFSAKNLAKVLTLSTIEKPQLTGIARTFFRQVLLDSLLGEHNDLLPIHLLPPSELSSLLTHSKQELIQLIDALSIYDLAVELRQIVETKMLRKIYSFLTKKELEQLQIASAHKETFTLQRVALDRWDGTEESFRSLLHKRGLARLGLALSGQHPDFIWYLCHQLDIGRGSALFKLCAPEPTPGITEAICKQIAELL